MGSRTQSISIWTVRGTGVLVEMRVVVVVVFENLSARSARQMSNCLFWQAGFVPSCLLVSLYCQFFFWGKGEERALACLHAYFASVPSSPR